MRMIKSFFKRLRQRTCKHRYHWVERRRREVCTECNHSRRVIWEPMPTFDPQRR